VTGIGKLWRALLGAIVVVGLLVVLNSWWSDYRSAASASKSAAEASRTVEPTAAPAPAPANQKTVIVIVSGLSLRDKPDATGKSLKALKRGEKYILVGTAGTWLQLRDAAGATGWATNNPAYLKTQK
jgi:hypothetical protein